MFIKDTLLAINFDTRWSTYQRPTNLQAPRPWRQWLLDRGSLTTHLIAASNNHFKVALKQQGWAIPYRSEAKALKLKNRQAALIREVELLGNEQVYVLARTVIPASTLTGKYQQLATLGNKSLGSVLFSDPSMRRGTFQICQLRLDNGEKVWARRSVFYLSGKPLLVCEVFLPILASTNYQPPLFAKGNHRLQP